MSRSVAAEGEVSEGGDEGCPSVNHCWLEERRVSAEGSSQGRRAGAGRESETVTRAEMNKQKLPKVFFVAFKVL